MADLGVGGAGSNNNINYNKNNFKNPASESEEFARIFADLVGDDDLEIEKKQAAFKKDLKEANLKRIPTAHEMIRASAASSVFQVKKFFKKAGIIPEFDLNEEDYKGIHKALLDILKDEELLEKNS